ncbi:RNA polymerase sigma factor [Nocardia rhizosphaerae]|uniref:RNA polymerase sigma factor n=1 Tax=Nocardia rhizosphaerae TaxID=1691571 RepID=A0ABV8L8L7_9NOCA
MNRHRRPGRAPGPDPEPSSGPEDRDAVRALYRATGAAAFGLALRVLHRRGSAEDVVREAYRRLWVAPWRIGAPVGRQAMPSPPPDLGTPWGRAAFAAGLASTAGDDAVGTLPGGSLAGTEQSRLLAQVHRLAVRRLRLDRHDGDDLPWLAASARLGFADPLDRHCEVFVLAYYGGRTYRAIGRELGLRVPTVTRLLAEGIERLAETRIPGLAAAQPPAAPGSPLALADAYALDAVAELEHHHIENKLAAVTPRSLDRFAARVTGVHEVLARLAADDQRTPPRQLEARILADLGAGAAARRAGKPPWLRRRGGPDC